MEETQVIIVGAGPAGLAVSACLNRLSIRNIVLERDDCCASLWRKRAYDRLKLHLAKNYCSLPYMSFPDNAPTYISRVDFLKYLDEYMSFFGIEPRCCRTVERAWYNEVEEKWKVGVDNTSSGVQERYDCKFLVVATGENSEGFLPNIPGLESFNGEVLHSSGYDNGQRFRGKDVLVVGCGNSGMEIAYDLSNHDANTSIVVRSPVHVLTKDIVRLGMFLLKYFPCNVVDSISINLAKLKYGDFSKYGIQRPRGGPFLVKAKTGRSPTIDVGCMKRIQRGEIKVLPSITCIKGEQVRFAYGIMNCFDAIIFATGYKSTVLNWLEDDKKHFNEDGMPNQRFPTHWKGENGLYCVGFGQQGLLGISNDAQKIASDISLALGLKIAME
ncbi:probable indole-3-pyruvate monooxygenase YUCCA11 [Benincasa hispida]|uniref:probable indole-3-pyruvate monooxygenase YUCCA11 n=1 Tax=Benincasa hispida TaxID=102211 RepID=UPI0018FFA2B3|nr:probable indole-3-pyruvate monooxygenase YUCCA11 [Benincasa hispida]